MTVPIVPGEPEPTPPPQVVYVPQPPQAANPGRVAGNTLVVVLTLVGIFCGIPLVGCMILAIFGGLDQAINR